MHSLRNTLTILCLMLVCGLSAQTTKYYSTEQGLSNSLINQLYQDSKGYIWIATEDGLNRFDGTRFSIYRNIPNDSTSLKNNYVRSIFEDSKGNLYIGCINGLMKYNRNTNNFHEIKVYDNYGRQLIPHISSVIERANGDIWLASSGSGLFSIRNGEDECKPEAEITGQLTSVYLSVLYEDSNNQLWIGHENADWQVYSFTTESFGSAIPPPPLNLAHNSAVTSIKEDGNGNIFIGTLYNGLIKYDIKTNNYRIIPDETGYGHLPVKSLCFINEVLFVGTDGKGMKIFNPDTFVLEEYEPSSAPFDFSTAKVHNLIQDKDGNVWAALFQKGLFFVPSNLNGFRYYGYKSFRKNNIGSNCVMAIHKSSNGIIWVGTDNDGLYSIDEKTEKVRHYESSENYVSVPTTVLCIQESPQGKLYLGSYLTGLSLFDPATGGCKYFDEGSNKTMVPNKIYCMTQDNRGSLWIGTYGGGLYKLDMRTDEIVDHYFRVNEDEDENAIANNWVNALHFDGKYLWLGTYKGLSRMDITNDSFVSYSTANLDLPSNLIFSLKEDASGLLWIGTDNGLACLDKNTLEIKNFNTKDGLGGSIICAIECDADDNIWVSTHSGVSKYSRANNTFINYYSSDGLQGTEFTRGAGFRSKDGEILFGGINGITSFYPEDIHEKRQELNVYTTEFYLFNNPVNYGQKSGRFNILNKPVLEGPDITLSALDNMFSIELSTFNYTNPEGIVYHYRLEGFDTNWLSNPPGNNRITYTNLSPRKYKLHFYASDRDNLSPEKVITIHIRPLWYQTLAAKIVYLILALLLGFGIFQYIRSKILHRSEMLRMENAEKLNEAKLQFFTDISHEIRTPMTLIIGPLEKLMQNNREVELQQSYSMIYRNAKRILRLINQLMDIRKLDRGQMKLKVEETELVSFIEDIMRSFEYSAQKNDISFKFNHGMEQLTTWIDRSAFDKVLFNILSNAFKFTPEGGEIIVSLSTIGNHLEMRVVDSGIGISEEELERIFDRFYQSDNDTKNTHSGTGIGLHLTRSLLELHHGTIKAAQRSDGNGSIFIVMLPLGSDSYAEEEKHYPQKQQTEEEDPSTKAKPLSKLTAKEADIYEIAQREIASIERPKTKYKVLIVEDDKEINNYIKAELSHLYYVYQAFDGKEGLNYTLTNKPDLIISDIMMPALDGISLSRKLKTNVNTEHIPIILLTAKLQDEDRIDGLESGADVYLTKPFNADVLRTTVNNLFENRERLKGKFQAHAEGKIDKIEIKSSNDLLMERIIAAINQNYHDPDFSVEKLSKIVGISRVHLHRKMRELTNQSASHFIRNIRIKQAAELLKNPDLSVSDIAYSVGFSTLSHFSTSFKDIYGMTPREYMQVKN